MNTNNLNYNLDLINNQRRKMGKRPLLVVEAARLVLAHKPLNREDFLRNVDVPAITSNS